MTAPAVDEGRGVRPMAAAQEPRRAGGVVVVAIVLAVALVAAGAVLVRETLVVWSVFDGEAWLPGAFDSIEGMEPTTGLSVAGGIGVLAGLWLVVVALGPRVRSALRVGSETGVWIGRSDVAKLATRAAIDIDGVMGARTSVSQRTVTVTVRTLGASDEIVAAVRSSVENLLLPVVGITVRVVNRRA